MKRLAVLFLAGFAASAAAAPSINVVPPDGARFLQNQRFDLRVEGKGTGPYSASLSIDGVPQAFTSGAQNTSATDGISDVAKGWGGFNVRGYASGEPGWHTISADFADATGTAHVSSRFQIVDAFGRDDNGGRRAKNVIIMLGDGMGVAHRTAARLVKYGVTGG